MDGGPCPGLLTQTHVHLGGPALTSPILSTVELLRLAKGGDDWAREQLFSRYLPRLTRWASGRLPMHARALLDTGDLVHETLLRALEGLDRVEVRGPGGFQAYVRQAVLNRIKDQVRWSGRRPQAGEEAASLLSHPGASPLDEAIGAEVVARFERALAELAPDDQELLHLRLELDFSHEEIAAMTGRPTPDAARMAVQRALRRLAQGMGNV